MTTIDNIGNNIRGKVSLFIISISHCAMNKNTVLGQIMFDYLNGIWIFIRIKKKYERANGCKFLKLKQHMDRIQRENKEPQSQPNFTQISIMIKLKKIKCMEECTRICNHSFAICKYM